MYMLKSAEISYLYKHSEREKKHSLQQGQLFEKSFEYVNFQSLQR